MCRVSLHSLATSWAQLTSLTPPTTAHIDMAPAGKFSIVHAILPAILALFIFTANSYRKTKRFTKLRGPRNSSFIFGLYRYIQEQEDSGAVYENWSREYGPAFTVSGPFGSKRIVICDPKANSHFYSRETYGYVQPKLARVFIENLVCLFSGCVNFHCRSCNEKLIRSVW